MAATKAELFERIRGNSSREGLVRALGRRYGVHRRLVREARPLWRQTEIHGRRARDELIEALSRITPTTPALSDPGVLGGFACMLLLVHDGTQRGISAGILALAL